MMIFSRGFGVSGERALLPIFKRKYGIPYEWSFSSILHRFESDAVCRFRIQLRLLHADACKNLLRFGEASEL
jgi:hypothetical protein